jgi:cell division protein FtsB
MQSLRDRQIREVLDEDLNINRMVNDLTRKKVRLSQEVVAPRKTRDVEIEVSVEKLVESINKIIETKLTSLEYLFSRIATSSEVGDAEGRRAYNAVINNGDFLSAYNEMIRLYMQPSLSRTSQEVIRTKFQEFKPNLDSIIYGISELIQYLFESGRSDKDIFQLVRSQAVYVFVREAVYRGSSFKPIEQNDIRVNIQGVLSELSEVQRQELKNIAGKNITEKSLLDLPIEISQNNERLKALEAEFGFKLPQDLESLMGKMEKETIASEYGNLRGTITAENKQELMNYISAVRQEEAGLKETEKRLKRHIRLLQRDIDYLEVQVDMAGLPDDNPDDAAHPIEEGLAGDLAQANIQMTELQAELQNIQDRIAQINTRIDDLNAQYAWRMANAERDTQGRLGERMRVLEKEKKFRLKRVGPVAEVGDEKAEAMPTLTKEELNKVVENASSAQDAFVRLQFIAMRFGYRVPDTKKYDKKRLNDIIKGILDRQSKSSEPATPSTGRPPRDETTAVLVRDIPFEEVKDDGTEPLEVVEVLEEGRPSGRGRFGRFNSRSGVHKTFIKKMPFRYLDERNNIHKIMGKGIFTDVKNWFSDTFS